MNTYWISFQRNEKGETPLHRACIEGNLKKVEKLIEQVFHIVITLYFMNDSKLVQYYRLAYNMIVADRNKMTTYLR